MKKLTRMRDFKMFALFFILSLFQTALLAQDSSSSSSSSTVTTHTTTETQTWYTEPWVWVVGGIILLIILIALFRGNNTVSSTDTVSSGDKVTVTKTTSTDV